VEGTDEFNHLRLTFAEQKFNHILKLQVQIGFPQFNRQRNPNSVIRKTYQESVGVSTFTSHRRRQFRRPTSKTHPIIGGEYHHVLPQKLNVDLPWLFIDNNEHMRTV
jgi:hypothetical protein